MSLDLYNDSLGIFEFTVDDPTTVGVDDLSAVTWVLRILGADDAFVDVDGTYESPTVTCEVSAAVAATFAPGVYRVYLIAQQDDVDDILVSEDVLRVHALPIEEVS